MYQKYFGLKEPSFSIAPDPEYLYLTGQHREALAHLLYGAGETGGFVLLTGEVGTGKTTVCRAFLEQLPAEVEVAMVLNPAMNGVELLRTLCDELHIELAPDERSTKHLIDRLNRYLLDAHAKGRRPVLMIDEAQTLRPRELELVRLLTNLETNKHKLLQIFLVGQPELRRLIESEALRQLSQRITARFHLGPLTRRETAAYVRHRLAVAGVDRPLFTQRALRHIHAFTGGVPRLINILCDRALLGTCVERGLQVTPAVVKRAARELWGKEGRPRQVSSARAGIAIALLAVLVAGGVWLGALERLLPGGDEALRRWLVMPLNQLKGSSADALNGSATTVTPTAQGAGGEAAGPPIAGPAGREAAAPKTEMGAALTQEEVAPVGLASAIDIPFLSRDEALRVLLRRWGVEVADLGGADPCDRILTFGLRCQSEGQGTWGNLRFFNRPVMLHLQGPDEEPGFAVLGALAAESAVVDALKGGSVRIGLAELDDYWTGDYLLLWQPPPMGTELIGPGASREAVLWLRQLLAQAPDLGYAATESGRFDTALDAAVQRFQRGRGLAPDGIAGYRTLIQLHNVVGMPGIPRLVEGL